MGNERDNAKFAELIEACRPGSADLQEGDMSAALDRVASDAAARQYYERVQRADSRMAIAFHDVQVPDGLAERLLSALDATAPATTTINAPALKDTEIVERPVKPSRRRLALRLALAASLLALVAGGLAVLGSLTPYSSQQCVSQALQAQTQLNPSAWRSTRGGSSPAERRPQTRLRAAPNAWQPTTLLGDDNAVAYRYGQGATLIVCQPSKPVSALPSAPPSNPQQKAPTSDGTHVAAWIDGGLVHVLVVTGPIKEYRRMTDTRPPVIAKVWPQSLRNRYDG